MDYGGDVVGKYDDIIKKVNAQYKGKYAAVASDVTAFKMERIPTGILAVDAITYGGIPKGRISIFWGEWSAGKTFTSFKTVARTQRTCKKCLSFMAHEASEKNIVDIATGEVLLCGAAAVEAAEKVDRLDELTEMKGALGDGEELSEDDARELKSLRGWHTKSPLKDKEIQVTEEKRLLCPRCGNNESLTAVWTAIEDFEPDFARMCGVDLDNLLVVKSEYAEQAIDISADVLRSGQCDLLVIDSVAMLTPAKEIEESAEKWQQGLMARLMNKALRRWASGQTVVEIESETGSKPTLLLINQVRDKIGVMYGDPSTMPGGKGQRFANSLVLRFRGGKKTKLEDTKETVNQLVHVKVDKSKVCPPDENADFVIWLREHQGNIPGTTSEPKIVMESALKEGIIDRQKSGYEFAGQKFTSQKAILALLTEDEMLLDSTRMQIIHNMNARRLRHA